MWEDHDVDDEETCSYCGEEDLLWFSTNETEENPFAKGIQVQLLWDMASPDDDDDDCHIVPDDDDDVTVTSLGKPAGRHPLVSAVEDCTTDEDMTDSEDDETVMDPRRDVVDDKDAIFRPQRRDDSVVLTG